jgi:hypothetical protein
VIREHDLLCGRGEPAHQDLPRRLARHLVRLLQLLHRDGAEAKEALERPQQVLFVHERSRALKEACLAHEARLILLLALEDDALVLVHVFRVKAGRAVHE